jgi:hypothetical protein
MSVWSPLARPRVRVEATMMVLYLAIVLLAEFSALPEGHPSGHATQGPVGWELVAILWGTTIGLVLAHWFAFEVAARGVMGEPESHDRAEIWAELAAAACVATLASVPVLLLPADAARVVVPYVLAIVIGGVAYLVERLHGRSRLWAAGFATLALALGVVIATVKSYLAYH